MASRCQALTSVHGWGSAGSSEWKRENRSGMRDPRAGSGMTEKSGE
jgi:hypothetical protein